MAYFFLDLNMTRSGYQIKVPTSDGVVNFKSCFCVGNFVALTVNQYGDYFIHAMDRSEDKSTDSVEDIIHEWFMLMPEHQMKLVGVGEVSIDRTNPFANFIYIDDELIALVTTYPMSNRNDGTNIKISPHIEYDEEWYLHLTHQCIDNSNAATGEICTELAWCFFIELYQTYRE